ncbi:hypothetical protein HY78_15925 [Rhizorhabdus wittichii DC-6]|nr:hypothetical protein HY78_15925 [Rhizorhabdus wittichii DC-6]
MATIALAQPRPSPRAAWLARRVPASALFGIVAGWLILDLLLLCRFIGLAQPLVYLAWAVLSGGLAWLLFLPRRRDRDAGPTVATLLGALAVAMLLLVLGGEGRLFYANLDWQVRDAVLRDMTINPWPFTYASGDLLRAPIGMYLVPALAGKLWGQAGADLALLAQNGLLLGLLLAIGSTLFADRRRRLIALAVFLAFSGLDIVGQLVARHGAGLTPTAHLEGWGPSQFSSTITLAFWVPLHAIAGWICALGILLWRTGRLGLGPLLMLPPLVALWSPFGAMGAMPFVLHAAWSDLRGGRITGADIALPACATLIALPALVYLTAAGDAVGARFFPIRPDRYLIFLGIELIPWLLIAFSGRQARFGGPLLAIAMGSLLAMPLVQIGAWLDFAMRASIPALAILAVHLGDGLGGGWPLSARRRAALLALLAIGSVTGLAEIARALAYPVSPPPRCAFSRAWDETFRTLPKDSYLAPLDRVPEIIRPHAPARALPDATTDCFPDGWPTPPLF